MRIAVTVLMMIGICLGSDFSKNKLLDLKSHSEQGAAINAGTVIIPTSREIHDLTFSIRDLAITASFSFGRKDHPSEFVVGDEFETKLDGDSLYLKLPSGKQAKGKVIRRERLK